jgi:hypothetical protein
MLLRGPSSNRGIQAHIGGVCPMHEISQRECVSLMDSAYIARIGFLGA